MTYTIRIRVNEILLERHMTKQQLAAITGLRPSTISDLCKPTIQRVYLSTLANLCQALDITLDQLIVLET